MLPTLVRLEYEKKNSNTTEDNFNEEEWTEKKIKAGMSSI